MKQVVRTKDGELTFDSMVEVRRLYEQGFIAPDDEIRAGDSARWVKAGSLTALAGAQSRAKVETAMGLRIAMAIAVSVIAAGAFERSRGFLIAGLVLLGVLTPFFVYRRRD